MGNSDKMSIENVAQYLNKSVNDVVELVKNKEISQRTEPNGIFFNRVDIEQWAKNQIELKATELPESILIRNILNLSRVKVLENVFDKYSALVSLIDCFSDIPGLENRKELEDAIFYREQLMSTGIGLGVGVPHIRLKSVSSLNLAVAICKNKINDYESLDGMPVQIIIMVIAGKGQHQEYIRLLAYLSSILKNSDTRKALIDAESPSTIFNLLTSKA